MALGKTVSYTPFQETSFGYGSSEIATAHSTEFPNATDTVKVVITHTSGNWDSTGHISTPSSGTAVAVYNDLQKRWECVGERDDVDAVLDTLSFYPADKPESRPYNASTNTTGFQITEIKANQTTGTFANEEPPAIGDTVFDLTVYDGASVVSSNVVTFDPVEPSFGNQRPFFSVVPPVEDLSSTAHGTVAGGLVDFGTISHGTDTENVRVKCEFRLYNSTTRHEASTYGYFTSDENIYIGDKKPAVRNTTTGRFDFTGSVAEAQAFLDNIRYSRSGNEQTFDMYLTISDGVVGAEYTKTVYFSDSIIDVSTMPDVNYVEDSNPANWDLGNLTFGNIQPDVNSYTGTITLDSTGRGGTSSFITGAPMDTQSYNSSTGVLTFTTTNLNYFKSAFRSLRYTPNPDFNDSFNMTVDITMSNASLGTSYSSTQQTIAVTGQEVAEISNPNTSHAYTEDQIYNFSSGDYPQIIHQYNHDFDIVWTIDQATQGIIWRHGTTGFMRATSTGFKLSGNRNALNEALDNLYFVPAPDFAGDFTINFTVDRTSGDLTNQTQETGSFTMTATDLPDFTATSPSFNWTNNESLKFNSGFVITDTAVDNQILPAFGSDYTVECRFVNASGNTFSNAKLISTSTEQLTSNTGLGNTYTMVGSKLALNDNLANLKLVPDPLYEGTIDFFLEFKLTRNYDNKVITDFSPAYHVTFTNPTINPAFSSSPPLFDWNEDEVFNFDSTLRITETLDENKMYTTANGYTNYYQTNYKVSIRAKYWDGSASQSFNSIDWSSYANLADIQNTTISGTGTEANPLIITGPKAEVNECLEYLRLTPNTPDLAGSPATNGQFWLEAQIQRVVDSTTSLNFSPPIANFNSATDTPEYLASWTNISYTEDIADQHIFSSITPILDGAGDLFNASYTVDISLDTAGIGTFEDYVETGYTVVDYVSSQQVSYTGTKSQVNTAIQNTKFTPDPDINTNVGLTYSQSRTINGTTVTHANAVSVGTLTGIATPEFALGTYNNNQNYFVTDEDFSTGVSVLEGTETVSSTGVYSGSTALRVIENYQTTAAQPFLENHLGPNATPVNLTSRKLAINMGKDYDLPIKILDTAEDGGPSQYRIQFNGGTLYTPLGASLNLSDTGYQLKADLHTMLRDLHVTGVNGTTGNIPNHLDDFTANFTVHRRTYTGTETFLGQGTLNFKFLSGLQIWSYQSGNNLVYTHPGTERRIDNLTVGPHGVGSSTTGFDSSGTEVTVNLPAGYEPLRALYNDPYAMEEKLMFKDSKGQQLHGLVSGAPRAIPGSTTTSSPIEQQFLVNLRFMSQGGVAYHGGTAPGNIGTFSAYNRNISAFNGRTTLGNATFSVEQAVNPYETTAKSHGGDWLDFQSNVNRNHDKLFFGIIAYTDWGAVVKFGVDTTKPVLRLSN